MSNEFLSHAPNPLGRIYACPSPGGYADPACKPYEGTYIVESLSLPFKSPVIPSLALAAFVCVFFATSAVLLKYGGSRRTAVPVPDAKNDASANQTMGEIRPLESHRMIELELKDYGLLVRQRNTTGRGTKDITLLQSINTTFKPGILNVVMGPSGSGKTLVIPLSFSAFDPNRLSPC